MPFTLKSSLFPSVSHEVRGFYKGVTASALAVSVVSSVSFGTYKNALDALCKLRYGAADAQPSKLDVSLAGAAAGAARVGQQPAGKAQQEILFTNMGGWKSKGMFFRSRRPQGSLTQIWWVCFCRGGHALTTLTLSLVWPSPAGQLVQDLVWSTRTINNMPLT